jgi:hypothetical protein
MRVEEQSVVKYNGERGLDGIDISLEARLLG